MKPSAGIALSCKVSVITINYNDVDGLYSTLKSVASQTADDFELVVVDGHSDDGSAKLLEDMDDIIDVWVSEPDGGIYDAMNKGVSLASGSYVNFMNSGDVFHDEHVLLRAQELIEQDDPGLFYGRAYAQSSGNLYEYNSDLWKGMICSHQATFSKRALHRKFPYSLDYRIASDYRFFVQCDRDGTPPVPTELDVALIDTTGVSFHGMEERTLERLRICQEFYREPKVYQYFRKLAQDNDITLPEWASSEERWMRDQS